MTTSFSLYAFYLFFFQLVQLQYASRSQRDFLPPATAIPLYDPSERGMRAVPPKTAPAGGLSVSGVGYGAIHNDGGFARVTAHTLPTSAEVRQTRRFFLVAHSLTFFFSAPHPLPTSLSAMDIICSGVEGAPQCSTT